MKLIILLLMMTIVMSISMLISLKYKSRKLEIFQFLLAIMACMTVIVMMAKSDNLSKADESKMLNNVQQKTQITLDKENPNGKLNRIQIYANNEKIYDFTGYIKKENVKTSFFDNNISVKTNNGLNISLITPVHVNSDSNIKVEQSEVNK